jgi:hypothetical protein
MGSESLLAKSCCLYVLCHAMATQTQDHNSETKLCARFRVTDFAVLSISEHHICGLPITSLVCAARMASLAMIVRNRRESGSPDAPMGHRRGPMGLRPA